MYIEGPSDAGPRHFGFKKTDYLHNTSYGAEVLLIQNRDEKYESIPCFFFYLIDYFKKTTLFLGAVSFIRGLPRIPAKLIRSQLEKGK